LFRSYDPETTISDRVEFENERVEFLTGIANLMATKARLKMNTKKLYASDGRAVQELLKLATLLNRLVLQCGEIFILYILHDCQHVSLIPKQF
jgi:Clusterin-associated protein-1